MQEVTRQISQESRNISATACLAIAIGAQSLSRTTDDLHYARVYFATAQQVSLPEALFIPSINTVAFCTLAAFYMLTTHRRNGAYMYIGIAARGAYTLGLHHKSSYSDAKGGDALQRQVSIFTRRRKHADMACSLNLWKSICILDLVVCSILGRPSAVFVAEASDQGMVTNAERTLDTCSIAFEASFRASKIIGEIVKRMYQDQEATPADAERFLDRLTGWRQSLPQELRTTMHSSNSVPGHHVEREVGIASMNMACVYYFAVMLVTRPFLVLHSSYGLDERPAHASGVATTLSRLSAACVDASVYMVETVRSAARAGILLPNTCFIK